MPLDYQIDHVQKLVTVIGSGTVTDMDFFNYQRNVWSRPEVISFDELVDMTGVANLDLISIERVRQLASLAASMDDPQHPAKLAIVAREVLHFGLGRMYQSYRDLSPYSKKQVSVFETREEAVRWLGKTGP